MVMKIKSLYTLFAGPLLFATVAVAGDFLRSPRSYQEGFLSVIVEANEEINIDSSAAGEENCKGFKITEAQVRSYLQKAQFIDSDHDYQIGGCRVRGRLQFKDGQWGHFVITSSRTGYVFLPNDSAFLTFCRYERCRDKIYGRFDGVNSDSEDAEKEDREQKAAAKRRSSNRR